MANTLPNFSFISILTISIFLSSILYQATASDGFTDELSVKRIKNNKPMTLRNSKFTFYWHDVVTGDNATSIQIIKPVVSGFFGMVRMIDNALTLGPDPKSKEVGRAQGLYGADSLDANKFSLIMMMNFVFTTGKYNGSTITIMGNNPVMDKVREMSVIGGSGLFRFARGYAQAQTNFLNVTSGDAIVKYDVYVMHY